MGLEGRRGGKEERRKKKSPSIIEGVAVGRGSNIDSYALIFKILQKIFFYMLFESKKLYFCSLKTEMVL